MRGADVIVVGAGPAGSSTAWSLARAGVEVLVLDKARFPRDKPCAEYLSPQASRILADMGALDECERSGAAQLSGMTIRSPNGHYIRGDFAATHGFHGFRDRGLALRRLILDSILLDRARATGASVVEGTRVTDLLRDTAGRVLGVQTLTASGCRPEIRARLVVGADGLRSVVARRAGLAAAFRFPRRIALIAHYAGVEAVGAHGEMHVERDGYLGLADVGAGVTNVAVVVPAGAARGLAGDAGSFMETWISKRRHVAHRFRRADRLETVRATGPFAVHSRRAWTPGAALVGDAADFFDPFTGEGIYAALRGGELLASAAIDSLRGTEHGADEALRSYHEARRREFSGKWMVERLVGLAVAWPLLMNRVARSLSRDKGMADLLVGVAGDFVPAREVLRPSFLWPLLSS
ncbi:MAG: NAD(P)/FAD-dependent oxidoreductase [Gemmatimonadaceae bacterium]